MAPEEATTPWTVRLDGAGWQAGIGHGSTDENAQGDTGLVFTQPHTTLLTRAGVTCLQTAGGRYRESREDPLGLLADALDAAGPDARAAGYFGYDLARAWLRLENPHPTHDALPEMAVGIYGPPCPTEMPQVEGAARTFQLLSDPQPHQSLAAYTEAFTRIQAYIRAGDCYQVNYALRFAAACSGHAWPLYQALRLRNPAPFSAWLDLPGMQVLSSSPESFLLLEHGEVMTRPIKGTRPRGATPEEDARLAAELAASSKDRAENLMIVDLLRNDLGKVCVPGSIHVPERFAVESFATVHHLVSTVRGQLSPGKTPLDLLRATLPGGSITGAPKRRAMQIIDELEPQSRGVYCGAIGWVGHDALALNIAIRTLVVQNAPQNKQVHFWAGGGLVADSDAAAEYQECLDKARALRETLQSFATQ